MKLATRQFQYRQSPPSGLVRTKEGVLKTPLSCCGGKQTPAGTILGLVPPRRLYCGPFIGGAAVFSAKEPSKAGIINDTNGETVNFYEVLRRDFAALEKEIAVSLHSRAQHRKTRVICENPDMFDRVKRAWAVWMLANGSCGCMLDGGFGYDRTGGTSKKLDSKRIAFTADYAIRLQRVQIECCDALRIIRSRDVPDAFFYLDPPYADSDQGHYDGYTQEDFDNLLKALETLQGKFLLSSFRNKALTDFTKRNGWHRLEFSMTQSMSRRYSYKHGRVEILTANYPVSVNLDKGSRKEPVSEE
jgi:DNA adenine methylase